MLPSYRLSYAIDIDAWAAETYSANLPLRPTIQDLTELLTFDGSRRSLRQQLGIPKTAPLVLIGGPPCQGFSAHRKKHGGSIDHRNSLITTFAGLATILGPDVIVMENVPELLARKHWALFQEFESILAKAGYYVTAQIHNLAEFGVPQERFRVLILAARRPLSMPNGFLRPNRFKTVRDAIGSLSPVKPGKPDPKDPMHLCTNHRLATINTIRRIPKDGGSRPLGVGPACLDRVDGFRDVYGRMYWDRPANTITAFSRNPASGRYVHPTQNRGLTIREAALLQAFPTTFQFAGPFDHKYLQIGNAVPPAFSAYLAAHILSELAIASVFEQSISANETIEPTSNSFSSGIAGRKKGNRHTVYVSSSSY
jgi:DNA (cytosine-5)-methyltransferase 1